MSSKRAREAQMLIESKGFAPAVRSAASTKSWSRLYQAGSYFVDLMLKPADVGSVLQGQVLRQNGETLPVHGMVALQPGFVSNRLPLALEGNFSFPVQGDAVYTLELELDGEVFIVQLSA